MTTGQRDNQLAGQYSVQCVDDRLPINYLMAVELASAELLEDILLETVMHFRLSVCP